MSRSSGMNEFRRRVVPGLLRPGLRVLDVGGGRAPVIPSETVERLDLKVIGLDVSEAELLAAPRGSYAELVVGDMTDARIPGTFDLILSQAVLEHVHDTRRAIANLAGVLSKGGTMAHFVPCRNAPFAVLNRLLGNSLARRILFGIYPERERSSGFPAYYDRCVPSELGQICKASGLEIVSLEPYFVSDYWQFFAPAHALDLSRQVIMHWLRASDLAETMVVVARKPPPCPALQSSAKRCCRAVLAP
jgi:2-polyprenyl-6-hydroxyphenyl methylase/3-demethylubiquinone-9 3-methyltransferase